ncbi:unnamed protein product [Pleuronectes platessa]|uniref:Uncharacterized protein n=1 Tax=Pleuronectes platessa TaxID=8262 RepID=A0A9N7Y749_PLEPL|nr:unnamed protein product [Pleuronectes platessa]
MSEEAKEKATGKSAHRKKKGKKRREGEWETRQELSRCVNGVTMTTTDPLGEGGSERKLVISWRDVVQPHIKYQVALFMLNTLSRRNPGLRVRQVTLHRAVIPAGMPGAQQFASADPAAVVHGSPFLLRQTLPEKPDDSSGTITRHRSESGPRRVGNVILEPRFKRAFQTSLYPAMLSFSFLEDPLGVPKTDGMRCPSSKSVIYPGDSSLENIHPEYLKCEVPPRHPELKLVPFESEGEATLLLSHCQ